MAAAGNPPSGSSIPRLPLDATREIQTLEQEAQLPLGDGTENASAITTMSSAPPAPNDPIHFPASSHFQLYHPETSDKLNAEWANNPEKHQDCADSQGILPAMSGASSREAANVGDYLLVLAKPSESLSHDVDDSPHSPRKQGTGSSTSRLPAWYGADPTLASAAPTQCKNPNVQDSPRPERKQETQCTASTLPATNMDRPFLVTASPTESRHPNVDDSPLSERNQKVEPMKEPGNHVLDWSRSQYTASGVPTSYISQGANCADQISTQAAPSQPTSIYGVDSQGAHPDSPSKGIVSSLRELSLAALSASAMRK